MGLKNDAIFPLIHYGIMPYLETFAVLSPLRKRVYGEGRRRRIYFPKEALRRLGIAPPGLSGYIPFVSPIEVSELNEAAEQYRRRYGAASLKRAGREQGGFFLRKGFMRKVTSDHPYRAFRFLMNCLSFFIGAKNYIDGLEMGRYARYHYLEGYFPFTLDDGKISPGEEYFWTFTQGVISSDLCHGKQMRAEVFRKNGRVYVVSKSVEEWGDYLLDNIDRMF